MRKICTLILVVLSYSSLRSQNFDADSVYYTPVPKQREIQKKPVKLQFRRDTIREAHLIRYYFNFQMSSLMGCSNCDTWEEITLSASTLHGISIGKKLRAGVGIGLDTYDQWKTMPVFGSATFDLIGTRNKGAVFVQANYGWAHGWRRPTFNDVGLADVEGGQMMSAQAGYRIRYHDLNIWISVGPKTQRVYSYFEFPTLYVNEKGVVVEGPPHKTTIKQDINRFMISVALGWR